jgi:hypothetical protein
MVNPKCSIFPFLMAKLPLPYLYYFPLSHLTASGHLFYKPVEGLFKVILDCVRMTKATDLFQLFDVLIQLKVVENDGHEE